MSINVGSAIAYLTLDKSSFTNGIKSAGSDLKNFVSGSNSAEDSIKSLGNSMTSAGSAMAMPSIAAGGFLAVATNTAMGFEEQMSKVKAISGATGDDMVKLSTLSRDMGASTKFSAKESGEALEYMAMAGWKTDQMMEGLPGILNLAAAAGEDLGTTSDIVTDALTGFGLTAKDSGHFADVLASASSNANTNVSLLGESFKYVAPVAGALKYSAEDTSLALGLMANAGIKGSSSGTALRAALTNMVKPTDNMADVMDQYGISLTNTDGSMKSLKEVMDTLRDKMGGLDEQTKASAAATLFGKEAMSGMLSIINASDADYNKLYDNLTNADGASKKMADTMQDNLKGQLTTLNSAFEELQISLATAVVPMLNKLVSILIALINKFNALPQPVKSAIGMIIGGIALLSPAFLILGKLVNTIGTVVGVFSKLKTAANIFKLLPMIMNPPVLMIIGIIGGIAVVVYEVIKHWDNLKSYFGNFWAWVKSVFSSFWEWLKSFFSKWGPTILTIIAPFLGIPLLIIQHWDKVKEAFTFLFEHLKTVCTKIGTFFSNAIEFWKGIWNGFKDFMGNIGDWIVDGLLGGLKRGMGKIKEGASNMANGVKNTFKKLLGINSPSRVFKGYGVNIGEGLIEGMDSHESAINGKFEGVSDKIKKLGNVKPNFNLSDTGLSGDYIGSSNIANSSAKQLNFTPNINMQVHIADTGAKGTAQLTSELKGMAKNAFKNSMVNEFMADALRL
ncbi:phage tail tape measure protein [Clostridium botulinum]|uniref:Phage tail tape measure protein n=2 Tax=Clostridium botulinum TaxID=1491 RepID=A0A6B4JHH7_CLOBO|nr:phage tail tape measure protein [Clostridium botulinum]EES48544.1 phage protein [Clostridium botulinum E1 str. 'BoNT E Beluga']MBY6759739.1 phage tail tape measure protein [Clostridium botulinum]MBY6918648.1 phage tail tape measure protein [Clostridium botulinum]MCR1129734.1 phage tail tape measure protein [Clostridium botulinum]NFG27713.1 phage tail tape measure protein [Clostridium botulinum]